MQNNFSRFRMSLVLGVAVLFFSSLSYAGALCPITPKPVKSEEAAISLVEKAVQVYKLTPLAIECLSIEMFSQSADSGYLVDVREKHTQQCGGDPMVSPRLFSIQVHPNGHLTSDANRLDRTYKLLTCPNSLKVGKKK